MFTYGQGWINPALAFDLGVGFGCEPPALSFMRVFRLELFVASWPRKYRSGKKEKRKLGKDLTN